MNLAPRWVAALAVAGIEAKHWSSVGDLTAADEQIMAWAATEDYVVLTHDLDFGAILAASHGIKPSVVQIRADNVNPDGIAGKVIAALRQLDAELAAGALVTVDPVRTRLRILPITERG